MQESSSGSRSKLSFKVIHAAQAARAPPEQKESGQKAQVQEPARNTSGSSEEIEEDEKGTASLREWKWVILRITHDHLSNYTPKSIARNDTVLAKEPLSSVSGVGR